MDNGVYGDVAFFISIILCFSYQALICVGYP